MVATFAKRNGEWCVVTDRYVRSGERIEVQRRDGTVSIVRVGREIERPRGVQKHGDYVYAVER